MENISQQIQVGYTYYNGASRNGNDVYEPKQFPIWPLLAITGTKDNSNGEYVPQGSLGALKAAGSNTDSALVNLYQAQLALRISMGKRSKFEYKESERPFIFDIP